MTLRLQTKIWIADKDGNVVFGLGRMRLLSRIDQCGSISEAAKSLNMGYRAAWGRIRATEKRLGKPLLVKNIGGSSGGGSQLTPFAKELLERFSEFHSDAVRKSDEFFDESLGDLLPIKSNR
jgi:molybdate transport system regulatory protein